MKEKRQKSEIEIIIEKKLAKLEEDLGSYERIHNEKSTEYIRSEIEFMKSLLSYFEELEEKRLFSEEETYDNNLMEYVLKNLPPQMKDRLKNCIHNDKRKIYQERVRQLEENKKKKIDSIISRNANSKAGHTFQKKGKTPLFITNIKRKISNAQKNDRQKQRNKDKYSEIIDWIERYYVSRYSVSISGKSYYYLKTNSGKIQISNPIDEESYKEFEKQKIEERISYEIIEAQELLLYSKLTDDLSKKIQNYLDLLKENSKVTQLIECLSYLSLNADYIETRKEKMEIIGELKKIKKENDITITQFNKSVDLNKIYNSKKEEIEKKKTEIQKRKEVEEDLKETIIDNSILIANNKWEENFVQDYIRKVFGREPTAEEQCSSKYYQVQAQGRVILREHIDSLNKELGDYLVSYLEKELVSYVMENYQISNEKEIDFLVSDAMLSPQERYIRDMIEAKKMSEGTRVEDLTSKDFKQIEKYKDRFYDDECDKKIQELNEKIKVIKKTCFTSIYKIEDVEMMVEKSKQEENTFEEAKSYFRK